MDLEIFNTRTLRAAALAGGLLALPLAAQAQSPGTSVPTDTNLPFWELIGGYEGDSHDAGYGFLGPAYNHPLSDDLAVTARVFATTSAGGDSATAQRLARQCPASTACRRASALAAGLIDE